MKLIRILRFYTKGIRLYGLVLAIMMTWAMFCGIGVFAQVREVTAKAEVLKSAKTGNTYLLESFSPLPGTTDDSLKPEEIEAALEQSELVKTVLTIQSIPRVEFQGAAVQVLLYEPEMVAFFPGLERLGIRFSGKAPSVVLCGERFSGIAKGDTVTLSFAKGEGSFRVADVAKNFYLNLSRTTVPPGADVLFSQEEAILLQATEQTMAKLEGLLQRTQYQRNLVVVGREGVSSQALEQLMEQVAPSYLFFSLDQISENAQTQVRETVGEELALPVFLAVTSLVAYFSVLVLTIKKKQKETAVIYLCGGSRLHCATMTFLTAQLYLLVPVVLGLVLAWGWQVVDWNALYMRALRWGFDYNPDSAMSTFLVMRALPLVRMLKEMHIVPACMWVVLWYYLGATVIALGVTVLSMAKRTPAVFWKGVSL